MTQEEKSLLLIDLCARLPYGIYVHHKNCPDSKFKVIVVFDDGRIGVTQNEIPLTPTSINECKPYLRPISSMTEEEKIELCTISYAPDEMKTIEEKLYVIKTNAENAVDFYNRHHFDYRGLIEMGLALEAPENMYKNE